MEDLTKRKILLLSLYLQSDLSTEGSKASQAQLDLLLSKKLFSTKVVIVFCTLFFSVLLEIPSCRQEFTLTIDSLMARQLFA